MHLNCFVFDFNDNYHNLAESITEMRLKTSLDKPCQEVTLTIPYSVYSTAFPALNIECGNRFEIWEHSTCLFKGKVETVNIKAEKETMTITCYDYIRNLMKSKVTYNFNNVGAYRAIEIIFNDLNIPYKEEGILGGKLGGGWDVTINHLIKNKSAYEACMMIATEVFNQKGTRFYFHMDTEGYVYLMPCDKYWSKQTIRPCSDVTASQLDGTLIEFSYKEDASDLITRVALFDSKGNRVNATTGEVDKGEEEDNTESPSGGSSSSGGEIFGPAKPNGKTIGIDMGHNTKVPGASKYLDEVTENRNVGRKLISLLKQAGYNVINCTDDEGSTESEELHNRTNKANAQKLDLFLSLHLDSGGGQGSSIFYNSKANVSLANAILKGTYESCDFRNRGASSATYYVLSHNNNPAMLLEICFTDSIADKSKYDADKVAKGICEAIKNNL